MRRTRWLVLVGCLVAVLVLSSCSERGISKEPTDYMSFARVGGDFVPTYYTEQHKDVKAVLQLTDKFLQVDQNQDWRNLRWERGNLLTACPG